MKKNKKETAVEWLYSIFELHAQGKREAPNWWDLERAIHMEKEQIREAYEDGVKHNDAIGPGGLNWLSDEYYNENYGE